MYGGLKHDGTPIYVHNTVIKIPNTQLPTYWISHGNPCSARSSIPLFLLLWLYKGSSLCSATAGNVEKFTAQNIKYCQVYLWQNARQCHFDMCKVKESRLNFVYQNTFGNYFPSGVSSIYAHCFHKINVCNHSDHLCSLSVCHTCTRAHAQTYTHSCRPYLFIHSFIQLHTVYFMML
jgi:hypothetical protein